MADVEPVRRAAQGPVFVTGSLLRHILVMTAAGAIGLMAIFIGDLANIYFLSQLGDQAIVAAVGYASSILYFSTAIGAHLHARFGSPRNPHGQRTLSFPRKRVPGPRPLAGSVL